MSGTPQNPHFTICIALYEKVHINKIFLNFLGRFQALVIPVTRRVKGYTRFVGK